MPRLLILTPTLGTSTTIAETVATVAAGCRDCLHLLVAPASAQAGLHARFPHHRLIVETQSSGMYSALNVGWRAAANESWSWFTYLNDDDALRAPGFGTALAMADSGTADVIYGRVCLMGEDGRPAGELPVARRPRDLISLLSSGTIPFAQPGMLVRRSLLEQLGGFDATFRSAGDLDFCVRALLNGARFVYVPEVVAAFRLRSGQLSKDETLAATEKARALAPLRENSTPGTAALLRFRVGNLGVYLDRLRRHGWTRMTDVYRKA